MTVNVSDWSEVPASNSTVDGISIAEGCPPGNVNGGMRSIMAGVRTFYAAYSSLVTTVAALMPKAGGTFSGTQPIYTGRGAYLHNNGSGLTSGRVFLQASGGGTPSGMAAGDWLVEY